MKYKWNTTEAYNELWNLANVFERIKLWWLLKFNAAKFDDFRDELLDKYFQWHCFEFGADQYIRRVHF